MIPLAFIRDFTSSKFILLHFVYYDFILTFSYLNKIKRKLSAKIRYIHSNCLAFSKSDAARFVDCFEKAAADLRDLGDEIQNISKTPT